ncbi:MAG: hypothetical protein AB8G95_24825 [Anaerolineae bacterium]
MTHFSLKQYNSGVIDICRNGKLTALYQEALAFETEAALINAGPTLLISLAHNA